MIYAHPDIKPTYIQDTIKAQLELEVTRSQYTNPGSSVDIEVEQIGLDGCFLKGVVKGMLLTAVGKDPNNQMFPVAWAIVEIESESSWTWFLRRLRVDIKTQDGDEWTFMSDKQKYHESKKVNLFFTTKAFLFIMLNTVATIFPKAEHRLCASHIYANWYSDFRGEQLKVAFYAVAKCANEAQLQKRLDVIENIHDGAKKSLEKKDIKQWCRAYFKGCTKCDSVDNNSTEAWNFVLIRARSKPIISMNEDLREYIMERRIKRLSFAQRWRLNYGPNIRDVVNENCSRDPIRSRGKDPFDYLHVCYSKDKFIAAYNNPVQVVGSEEFWPNSGRGELVPPLPKAMTGRPRKARMKRKYEPKKSKTKLSRHGRDIHCGICSAVGHNYKTCPVDDGGKYQPKKSKTKKPTKKSATKNMPSQVLNL
ncbi:elongation factor G, III-V domain-containing protein [Tanacetum coccineum]